MSEETRARGLLSHLCGQAVLALGLLGSISCSGSATHKPTSDSGIGCTLSEVTTLYADSDGGLISQPTIAGNRVVLALDHSVVAVPASGGTAITLAVIDYPTAPIVLDGVVYFQGIYTPDGGSGPQPSYVQGYSVTLADATSTPVPMTVFGTDVPSATDGSFLYLLAAAGAQVKRWTPGSTDVVDLATEPGLIVDALAVHGNYVYVAAQDLSVGGSANGLVARIAADGSGTFDSVIQGIGHPWNLVATDAGLFWNEDPSSANDSGSARIVTSGLDGSSRITLLSQNCVSMAVVGTTLFVSLGSEIDGISLPAGAIMPIWTGLDDAGFLTPGPGSLLWVDPAYKSLSDSAPVSVQIGCVGL